MGILGAIAKVVSKAVGGKMVARDIEASHAYLHKELLRKKGYSSMEYHYSNVNKLVEGDSGVSKDWIKGLINNSDAPADLNKITQYLNNSSKTYNLNASDRSSLFHAATTKLKAIQHSDAMDRMMELLAKHGDDFF